MPESKNRTPRCVPRQWRCWKHHRTGDRWIPAFSCQSDLCSAAHTRTPRPRSCAFTRASSLPVLSDALSTCCLLEDAKRSPSRGLLPVRAPFGDLCCLSKVLVGEGGIRRLWLWLRRGLSSAPRPGAWLISHSLPPLRRQTGCLHPALPAPTRAGLPGEAAPPTSSHPLSSATARGPELSHGGCGIGGRTVPPALPPPAVPPDASPHACRLTEPLPGGVCAPGAGPAPCPPPPPPLTWTCMKEPR